MKTIGLLGGMGWESTEVYYRLLNETVKETLGGLHSAPIVMISVDFQEFADLMQRDEWPRLTERLSDAASRIEAAGADLLLICSNTMHRVADTIQSAVRIPLLHIADAAAAAVRANGIERVGLLGTRVTMEADFYKDRLRDAHGLEVIVPGERDRDIADRIIFDELCRGTVNPASRAEYQRIIQIMAADGAEGIILGCTEITLLVQQRHSDAPLFDTTAIHAAAAVKEALYHG